MKNGVNVGVYDSKNMEYLQVLSRSSIDIRSQV